MAFAFSLLKFFGQYNGIVKKNVGNFILLDDKFKFLLQFFQLFCLRL